MKKHYLVTYFNGAMHYHFRCYAADKKEARKMCKDALGVSDDDITDVEEVGGW